jgi:hypothetical protein
MPQSCPARHGKLVAQTSQSAVSPTSSRRVFDRRRRLGPDCQCGLGNARYGTLEIWFFMEFRGRSTRGGPRRGRHVNSSGCNPESPVPPTGPGPDGAALVASLQDAGEGGEPPPGVAPTAIQVSSLRDGRGSRLPAACDSPSRNSVMNRKSALRGGRRVTGTRSGTNRDASVRR